MKKVNTKFLLILLVALFLQFYELGKKSLWEDEARIALKSFWSFQTILLSQKNVLFNLILSAWKSFGKNEFWLRTPSVLFALFSLIALYEIGKKLYSARVALLATFLLATSPFFLLESRQVKMYSLALFLSLLSIYFLLLFFETGRMGSLLSHAGISLMALLTHYMFVPFYIAQAAFVFLGFHKQNPSFFKRYLFVLCGTLFLFLFAYPDFMKNLEPLGELYLHSKSLEALPIPGGYFGKVGFVIYLFAIGPTVFPWKWGWVIGEGLLSLFLALYSLREFPSRSFKLTLWAAAVPVLLLSSLKNAQPHYSLVSLPFYALILAVGIFRLRPLTRNLCFAGCLLFNTYGLTNYFMDRQYLFITYLEPYREITQFIKTHYKPGDYFLHSQNNPPFNYYFWRLYELRVASGKLHSMGKNEIVHFMDWEEFEKKLPRNTKRIWFIERPPGQFIGGEDLILNPEQIYRENLDFRSRLDHELRRVGRWTYLKDPDVKKKERFLRKFYLKERITVSLYELSPSS